MVHRKDIDQLLHTEHLRVYTNRDHQELKMQIAWDVELCSAHKRKDCNTSNHSIYRCLNTLRAKTNTLHHLKVTEHCIYRIKKNHTNHNVRSYCSIWCRRNTRRSPVIAGVNWRATVGVLPFPTFHWIR